MPRSCGTDKGDSAHIQPKMVPDCTSCPAICVCPCSIRSSIARTADNAAQHPILPQNGQSIFKSLITRTCSLCMDIPYDKHTSPPCKHPNLQYIPLERWWLRRTPSPPPPTGLRRSARPSPRSPAALPACSVMMLQLCPALDAATVASSVLRLLLRLRWKLRSLALLTPGCC